MLRRLLNFPLFLLLAALLLGGCSAPQRAQSNLQVTITADGKTLTVEVPAGSTVQQALEAAGVTLNNLDRTEPPTYTLLGDGDNIRVIRVAEKFAVQEEIIPFERQILRNEALPEGETRIIQAGENGRREVTYRQVLEDGEEISNQPVKSVVVKAPVPEIVMVGVQTPFVTRNIPGRIVYLAGGNAWVMDGSTGKRAPVVTTGDLDGRVFTISPNGRYLLFTRIGKAEADQTDNGENADENPEENNEAADAVTTINSLWLADMDADPPELIDLGVTNVVHFAAFAPYSSNTIAYSTVEPRPQAPGWQANNDLYTISFSSDGWISEPRLRLEANAGGIYGWWGTTFAWAPAGTRLAFARPDAVGTYDFEEEGLQPLLTITPYQTRADWAWTPGLGWSPDGQILFTVSHGDGQPQEDETGDESSPHFNLVAYVFPLGKAITLVPDSGMFANPVPSPWHNNDYQVAFLQAIFPQKSDISRYRLMLMDRDGSNRKAVFPPEGAPGLMPQTVVWSPQPLENGDLMLALIYQGNLYLVDAATGQAQQLTGDGLVTNIAWR